MKHRTQPVYKHTFKWVKEDIYIAHCPWCDSKLKSVRSGGYKGMAYKCTKEKCNYKYGAIFDKEK
jgi:hypothetical protein